MAQQHAPRSLATAARVVRLPDPTQHARRQRDATSRLLDPTGARLMYVAAINAATGLVTLATADGELLDEEHGAIGGRFAVGDRVVRLPMPGTGARDAGGSYVVLGPVRGATIPSPTVTIGAGIPNGSIGSFSGTDSFFRVTIVPGAGAVAGVFFHVQFAKARPDSAYGVFMSGRGTNGARACANGYNQANTSTTGFDIALSVAEVGTGTSLNVVIVDPLFSW